MNVILADHAHRPIIIPALSIKSIVGVEHQQIPDKEGAKSIIRYDYGAGPMVAFLRTSSGEVLARIMERTTDAPQPWITLNTASGDGIQILAESVIAMHGLDPEEWSGANTRVDFDASGAARDIKFAAVVQTADEIGAMQDSARASVVPAQPAPARKSRTRK